MAVTDQIKNKVAELFKDLTSMHDIDRDTLKDLVKTEIEGHKTFIKSISFMTKNDMDKFRERLSITIPSSKVKEISSWQEYTKSLQTKASQIEHVKMFDSIIKTRLAMQFILEDLVKKFDKVFDNEIISITDLRKSQIAAVGFVSQSIILSNWSLYVWTLLSSLISGNEIEIPKYRLNYISVHTKDVATIVNGLISNDKVSVADYLLKLRDKGEDAPLAVNGAVNNSFLGTFITASTVATALTYIGSTISIILTIGIGITFIKYLFKLTQDYMEVAAHEKYLKNKEMKEWLEAHVAKLKMDLQSKNPNDPQYQKMQKIIDVYDEKIRDLDEKINEYMGE